MNVIITIIIILLPTIIGFPIILWVIGKENKKQGN